MRKIYYQMKKIIDSWIHEGGALSSPKKVIVEMENCLNDDEPCMELFLIGYFDCVNTNSPFAVRCIDKYLDTDIRKIWLYDGQVNWSGQIFNAFDRAEAEYLNTPKESVSAGDKEGVKVFIDSCRQVVRLYKKGSKQKIIVRMEIID